MNWADFKIAERAGMVVSKKTVDNIQTTSRATLSQAGWYRVAEYKASNTNGAVGDRANSCYLSIKQANTSSGNESHKLLLRSVKHSQIITTIFSRTQNSSIRGITKARYTYTGKTAYLEVYYALDASNAFMFAVDFPMDSNNVWKTITPVATEEEVDGVTVTTTYDIPANANPVTDLDLVQFEGTETLTTSVLEKAVTLSDGVHNFKFGGSSYTGGDLPNSTYAYGMCSVYKRASGNIIVVLWGSNTTSTPIVTNYYNGTSWNGWRTYATTADLANYLPKSDIQKTDATQANLSMSNRYGKLSLGVNPNGALYVYDSNRERDIITATDEGNTFNGTATGNLPLSGGGTVNGQVVVDADTPTPVVVDSSNGYYQLIRFDGNNTPMGFLGFMGGNPCFISADWSAEQTLLHTGNSNAVKIQSSVPTDTSALWVW